MGDNENIISNDKLVSEELGNFFSKCYQKSQHNWKFISNKQRKRIFMSSRSPYFKYKNDQRILTVENALRHS